MKRIIILSFIALITDAITALPIHHTKDKEYHLDVTGIWKDLDDTSKTSIHDFGGRWVLAGTFIFRNKSGDPVPLQELSLAWKGSQIIQNLSGSLFKKEPNKDFLPLEEMLVSEGHWNREKQTLHFKFKHQEYIGIKTIFFLVLTIPKSLEQALEDGYFTVITDNLPRQLKKAIQKNIPTLSLHPGNLKIPLSTNRLAFRHALHLANKT